ncbi:MAG: hypothetical protein HY553_00380, partial [Elusimicrobia bacterium]|nr:hypothetical protein [Elusimicrobiota bacterium]
SRPVMAGSGPVGLATPVTPSGLRQGAEVNVSNVGGSKLGALPRSRGRGAASALRSRGVGSNRTMGQLKFANARSGDGATAARENASKQFATEAFDQMKTTGGQLAGGPGAIDGAPGVVVPPGSGAPDENSFPKPPPVGPAKDVTPYQPQLDAAKGLGDAAGMLRIMGVMFMLAGAALMFAGWQMKTTADAMPDMVPGPVPPAMIPNPAKPPAQMAAYAIIAAGVAMVGAGIMALAMAQNMATQAEKMGDQIKNQYGQEKQGQIATDTAKAKADGKPYTPPDMTDQTKPNQDVKEAVEETSTATFQVQ